MKRREFIKNAVVGSLMLHTGQGLFSQQNSGTVVSLVQGDSPASLTKEAIAVLGGMGKFVSKGDKVLVKPNIGWDRTPKQAACTNPDVIKIGDLSLYCYLPAKGNIV